MKPIIGISGSVIIDDSGIFPGYRRSYVNEDYVDSVIQNGGIPYIIPFNENEEVIKEQLLNVQGLILSGGHDVDPHNYKEEPEQKLGDIWPERDQFDMLLLKLAEENGVPVLGICRGAQIINVYHGGTLIPNIEIKAPTRITSLKISFLKIAAIATTCLVVIKALGSSTIATATTPI